MKMKDNTYIKMSFLCNYIQHIKEPRRSISHFESDKISHAHCLLLSIKNLTLFQLQCVAAASFNHRALKQLPSANPCSRIAAFSSPSNRQVHLSVQKLHQGNTEGRKTIIPSKGPAEHKAYSQRCRYRLKFLLMIFFLLLILVKYIR